MSDPHKVTKDFEQALCDYTGAPYCVTTTSCTMALLLAVKWHLRNDPSVGFDSGWSQHGADPVRPSISIPKRTYVGVPMSIIHAGGRPTFRDEDWYGAYLLDPLPIWDSARRFRRGMYNSPSWSQLGNDDAPWLGGEMVCLSFHWSKVLGIQQGGAILHADKHADAWLRKARFDGRTEGLAAHQSVYDVIGYHAYLSPEVAAAGLMRLSIIDPYAPDLPKSDYIDLSQLEIFR